MAPDIEVLDDEPTFGPSPLMRCRAISIAPKPMVFMKLANALHHCTTIVARAREPGLP